METSWSHREWNARKTLGRRALFPGSMSAIWTSIRVDAGAQWIQRKLSVRPFCRSPPPPPPHRPSPCPNFALTAFHQHLKPALRKNVRALNCFYKINVQFSVRFDKSEAERTEKADVRKPISLQQVRHVQPVLPAPDLKRKNIDHDFCRVRGTHTKSVSRKRASRDWVLRCRG